MNFKKIADTSFQESTETWKDVSSRLILQTRVVIDTLVKIFLIGDNNFEIAD